MFNKKVKSFWDYISESLTPSYWGVLSNDTNASYEKEANDIANIIMSMLGAKDPSEVYYIQDTAGFGTDFKYVYDIAINGKESSRDKDSEKTLELPKCTAFISKYNVTADNNGDETTQSTNSDDQEEAQENKDQDSSNTFDIVFLRQVWKYGHSATGQIYIKKDDITKLDPDFNDVKGFEDPIKPAQGGGGAQSQGGGDDMGGMPPMQ